MGFYLQFHPDICGHWGKQWYCQSWSNGTALRNVNNCLNTNIYSYLEISGGQSSNLFLSLFMFSTPVLIIRLRQLKVVFFLHWCLIHAALEFVKSIGTSGITKLCLYKHCFRKDAKEYLIGLDLNFHIINLTLKILILITR